MTQQEPTPEAGRRKAEPEIIPPGADWAGKSRIWVSAGPHHTMRVRITGLGPVGIAALMLMIGILGLAGLMLVIGFALVGLAAAGVLVVGAILSGLLRSLSQRYRAEPRAGSGRYRSWSAGSRPLPSALPPGLTVE